MKNIFYCFLCLLAIYSCGDNHNESIEESEREEERNNVNEKPDSLAINLTPSTLTVTDSTQIQYVLMKSTTDWAITGMTDWCSVGYLNGVAGIATIPIYISANTEYDDRNCTLVVNGAKGVKSYITVTQKQKDALTITTSKYDIPMEGGTIDIEVKANIDYEYEIKDAWIHCLQTRSLKTSNITFKIDPSEELNKREGEIIFKNKDVEESVKIYQNGGEILVLSQNNYHLPAEGGLIKIEVRSNTEYEMYLPSLDWITSDNERSVSSHTKYYMIQANSTYETRDAKIIVNNVNRTKSDTVYIVQDQKNVLWAGDSIYNVGYLGGKIKFDVTSNVEYAVEISETWVKKVELPDTRSLNTKEFCFEVEKAGKTSRTATITLKSLKNGEIARHIIINQVGSDDIINFGDLNLKDNLIWSGYDIDADGEISKKEAELVIKVNCDKLISLEGIEFFKNLKSLSCNYAKFSELNLTQFDSLVHLSFSGEIDNLNISSCINLREIYCDRSALTTLDVSENVNLEKLICSNNKLTSLKIGKKLKILNCSHNLLKELDVSEVLEHITLDCSCNKLTSLKLSELVYELSCGRNDLKELDVSECVNLIKLNCAYNQLTKLDVSKVDLPHFLLPTGMTLDCSFNKLHTLNLSERTAYLWCHDNELSVLDLSVCPDIREVYCSSNPLKELNLSGNQGHLKKLCIHNTTGSCLGNIANEFQLLNYNTLDKLILQNTKYTSVRFRGSLTMLDVSNSIHLKKVSYGGPISVLNIEKDVNLKSIYCVSPTGLGKISQLDVSHCPYLEDLQFQGNELESLDVSNNNLLNWLVLDRNPLKTLYLRLGKKYDKLKFPEETEVFYR